jgi:hypothetical protein
VREHFGRAISLLCEVVFSRGFGCSFCKAVVVCILTRKGVFVRQAIRFSRKVGRPPGFCLISVSGRVILGTHNQTSTLLGSSVDGLDDINQLLLILQDPVQLVVVSCSEITHHVFVAEEEHDGHGIVELVHLVEIGDLVQITDVDDFVLAHAVLVPVATEADDD